MKKILLASLLIFNIGVYADDLVCMGNTNNGQLIQLNVDLNKRLGKVTIENATYDLTISNDFMHVWQNTIEDQAYTNSLKQGRWISNSYCRKCISKRAKTASC